MNSFKFRWITLMICIISLLSAHAERVWVNGFEYEFNGTEATVTSCQLSGDVVIPEKVIYNGVTYTVTSIGCLAFYCNHVVTSVGIPNTVIEIEGSAFLYADALKSLYIPKSVENIGGCAFGGCNALESIKVEQGNPNYDSREDCNAIIHTAINGIARDELFQGCRNTTFPSSLRIIGMFSFWLGNCPKDVVIPDDVTDIGDRAFTRCTNLRSITLGKGLNMIGGLEVFAECSSLDVIICRSSTPPTIWDGSSFEDNQYHNVRLCVPSGSVDNYRNANNWNRFNMVSPYYEYDFEVDGIYYHKVGNETVLVTNNNGHPNTYSGMINIPESVTYLGTSYKVTSIGDNTFLDCDNLIGLSIPTTISNIGDDAFSGCSIQTLIITGNGAWRAGALNLRVNELFVGSGVTSIENMKIEALNVYSFASNPPVCDENTFTSYKGALHVPPTSFGSYFAAPYWNNFLNITGDADFVWPTSVELSQSSALLEIGEELELSATILPSETSYENISWASTNTNVATVNDGVITAVSAGECDIIATSLTATATCHIVVVEKKISISLDQHTARVLPNHMITLTPTLTPISTNIIVSSSNPSVALARIADNKIQVAGIKEGTATIIVNSADGYAFPDSCVIIVYTEPGDLNCDGYVTIADVTALIDYLLTGDDNDVNPVNADIDKDNKVSISDVTGLIDYILNGIWPWETSHNRSSNDEKLPMVPVDINAFLIDGEDNVYKTNGHLEHP